MKNYERIESLIEEIEDIVSVADFGLKVEIIDMVLDKMNNISPFKNEPVNLVKWVKSDLIEGNDYNPNNVAPPEMELLELSILEDGYTQPIVTSQTDSGYEVVDGFHRNRVGRENKVISNRINGYLPIVIINESRSEKGNRIAATIRHNRARGKHRVDAMSDIIIDLKKRNWSAKKIATQLGMDQDEVLRLSQIAGLAEMFKDEEFSKSWDAEILEDEDFQGDSDALD